MSFRCCVGTCPDCVRLAWSLDRTCPPSLWGALSGKAIGSAGIAAQSSNAYLTSQRVLPESKADARGPQRVRLDQVNIPGTPAPKSFPLAVERIHGLRYWRDSSPPRGGVRGSMVDWTDGAIPCNTRPHLRPNSRGGKGRGPIANVYRSISPHWRSDRTDHRRHVVSGSGTPSRIPGTARQKWLSEALE